MPGKHDLATWKDFPEDAVARGTIYEHRIWATFTKEQFAWLARKAGEMAERDLTGRAVKPIHVLRYLIDRMMREDSDKQEGVRRPALPSADWLKAQPGTERRRRERYSG